MKLEDIQVGKRYWVRRAGIDVDSCVVLAKGDQGIVCRFSSFQLWLKPHGDFIAEVIEPPRESLPWWRRIWTR